MTKDDFEKDVTLFRNIRRIVSENCVPEEGLDKYENVGPLFDESGEIGIECSNFKFDRAEVRRSHKEPVSVDLGCRSGRYKSECQDQRLKSVVFGELQKIMGQLDAYYLKYANAKSAGQGALWVMNSACALIDEAWSRCACGELDRKTGDFIINILVRFVMELTIKWYPLMKTREKQEFESIRVFILDSGLSNYGLNPVYGTYAMLLKKINYLHDKLDMKQLIMHTPNEEVEDMKRTYTKCCVTVYENLKCETAAEYGDEYLEDMLADIYILMIHLSLKLGIKMKYLDNCESCPIRKLEWYCLHILCQAKKEGKMFLTEREIIQHMHAIKEIWVNRLGSHNVDSIKTGWKKIEENLCLEPCIHKGKKKSLLQYMLYKCGLLFEQYLKSTKEMKDEVLTDSFGVTLKERKDSLVLTSEIFYSYVREVTNTSQSTRNLTSNISKYDSSYFEYGVKRFEEELESLDFNLI